LVFLLPSGIRPVKDPLFLVNRISRWHLADSRITLVVAGLAYEPGYQELALRRIGAAAGVYHAGVLAQPDLHAAMREATAVLNTSLSECSPNAVLEAMDLGCPVLVRDIPGNTCLVEHERTGLVFGTPGDFEAQARRLITDRGLARRIAAQGQEFVRRRHGLDAVRAGYAAVVQSLVGRAGLPGRSRPDRRM
jgi:glycosyltransferase involved in cell wall biosynthesis